METGLACVFYASDGKERAGSKLDERAKHFTASKSLLQTTGRDETALLAMSLLQSCRLRPNSLQFSIFGEDPLIV